MDQSPTPAIPRHRAALNFIFVTVMLDMLAFGIIIPVLPHLIVELIGGSISKAAVWAGAFAALFMLMQFVFSPVQGALSDRFGRRTVILISSFGLGVDFIVMALAPVLWLLFVGRAVSGICAASFSTANAYIADITPKEKRAAAFGMLGAAFGIGFIVGPALGGFLGHLHIRLPFWVAAVLSLINFCYGWFVLPESLPKEKRSARFDWRHANPFGAVVLLRRYPQVFGLATVFFLINLAQFSLNSTYVLYTDYRYGWGPQAVGYTLGLVGLCSGLVQAVLVRRLMPRLGERRMILAGLHVVHRRLYLLRLRLDGLGVPARHSVPVPGWAVRAAGAGDDDPPGRPARAGPPAGCADQPGQPRRHFRPGIVRQPVRAVHQ